MVPSNESGFKFTPLDGSKNGVVELQDEVVPYVEGVLGRDRGR